MAESGTLPTRRSTQLVRSVEPDSSGTLEVSDASEASADVGLMRLIDIADVEASLKINACMLPKVQLDPVLLGETPNSCPLSYSDTKTRSPVSLKTPESSKKARCEEDSQVLVQHIEQLISFHLRKLFDLYTTERLFVADKYHTYLTRLFKFLNTYFETYRNKVKKLMVEGHRVKPGCLSDKDAERVLEVIEQASCKIYLKCDTIESACRGAGEITDSEICAIKIRLADKYMQKFGLDHLKVGCLQSKTPVATFSESTSRMSLSAVRGISFTDNQITTDYNDCNGRCTPSKASPKLSYLVGSIATAEEAAEGAVCISNSRCLNSSDLLQLFIRGDALFSPTFPEMAPSLPNTGNSPLVEPTGEMGKNHTHILKRGILSFKSRKQESNKQTVMFKKQGSTIKGSKITNMLNYPTYYRHHQKCNPPSDIDKWTREKSKMLDIWYRTDKDLSVSFKVRGKLPCPLFEVLAVLNEIDLASNWAPLLKHSTLESKYSKTTQIVRQLYDYPILGLKESISYTFGIDALHECGCVMVFSRSPPDGATNYMGLRLPEKGKVSRTQSADLLFLLFPINGANHTSFEFYVYLHHGLRYVPNKMITFFTKRLVKDMYVAIVKTAQNVPRSIYNERIQNDPEFYNWIREVINDFVNVHHQNEEYTEKIIRELDTVSLASFNIDDFNADS